MPADAQSGAAARRTTFSHRALFMAFASIPSHFMADRC